jgi:two-component system sensor histidine kinase PilS (NtrC family)
MILRGGYIKSAEKQVVTYCMFLIAIRLIFITAALALGSFLLRIEPSHFYYVIATLYFLTGLYAVLLIKKVWITFLIYFQLIADVILETVIIHYSGGIDSVFVFLYIPTVFFGSFMFPGMGAGIITGCSLMCYSALTAGEFYGLLSRHVGQWSSYSQGWSVVLYLLCFRMIIIGIASYLSSHLSRLLSEKTRELYQVKKLSDKVMDVMTGGVITTDRQDRILFANNYAVDILKIPITKLIGADWRPFFKLGAEFRLPGNGEPALKVDVPVGMSDGSTKVFTLNMSYLYDEKESPTGKVIIFHDVTEVLELKRKIQRDEKLVLLGEMAGGMAHEVRNPLGAICGSIQLLRERGSFDRKDVKLVDIIMKETDHLNNIIEEFLYYSKGKPKELKVHDMNGVIGEVAAVMRNSPRLVGSGIALVCREAHESILVSVDVEQIKQVFVNLINNGIDALPQGGSIVISAEAVRGWARVCVKDTGVGIPEELLKRIFDPFFSTKETGYGIGLALCQKIVENHQGAIDVESEEGKGTTFIVSLPLAR